jgi:PAS domain S-box-containing protein
LPRRSVGGGHRIFPAFHDCEITVFTYDSVAVASILGTSLDAVFTIDERGCIVDLNAAAVRMFGWSREEFLGRNISLIVPSPLKEKHDGFLAAFRPDRGVKHVLGSGQRLDGQRKDGSKLPVEVGISAFIQDGKRYFTGFIRDMTERQRAHDHMHFLAVHDADTGLVNYRGFCGNGTLADESARVICIRLEEFRRLLTSYSQHWCESTLRELAERLQGALQPGEIVGRIREDSFAVLVGAAAVERAVSLQQVLGKPIAQGKMHFPLTTTIGISRATGNLEQRLHDAQLACDRARPGQRGRINEFNDAMSHLTRRELQIENRLREAIEHGGLTLALQPKVRLVDRRITGAEALVRWNDPELGEVPPSEFIPVAEHFGLIGSITEWMLQRTLDEISRCADASISIAVNFSALDFLQPGLILGLSTALARQQVDPATLVVELTESVIAHDVELVKARMHEIKALGATISLDDFGTGYSSLSYLRQFPIDSLKIDISFVRDMPGKADAVAITTAIVSLAKALGLKTIAEGVENEAQAEMLQALEVDLGQGFLFSKPVTAAEFHRLLAAQGDGFVLS